MTIETMIDPRAELRTKYKELYRTRPFPGWTVEELQEKINLKEAANSNQNVRPFLLKDVVASYIDGVPYVVVNNEYKTLNEAKIIAHKNEVSLHLKEIARLESLTPSNELPS